MLIVELMTVGESSCRSDSDSEAIGITAITMIALISLPDIQSVTQTGGHRYRILCHTSLP